MDLLVGRELLNKLIKFSNSHLLLFKRGMQFLFGLMCGSETKLLRCLFPSLYKLSNNKKGTISSHIVSHESVGSWNFHFKRSLTDSEAEHLVSLFELIGPEPPLLCDSDDRRRWTLSITGTFSTSSLYSALHQMPADPQFPYKAIWNNEVPTKINFFIWLAAHDRIITIDKFVDWGFHHVNKCLLCGNAEENVKHLMFECSFSRRIWSSLLPSHGINGPLPSTVLNLMQVWASLKEDDDDKEVWSLIPAAALWSIWNERNHRTFEEISKTVEQVCQNARSLLLSWASFQI